MELYYHKVYFKMLQKKGHLYIVCLDFYGWYNSELFK